MLIQLCHILDIAPKFGPRIWTILRILTLRLLESPGLPESNNLLPLPLPLLPLLSLELIR